MIKAANKTSIFSFLSIIFFLIFCHNGYSEETDKSRKWLLSLGYGQLNSSGIGLSYNSMDDQPEALEDEPWHMVVFTFGVNIFSNNTQLMFDFLISEDKTLDSYIRDAPLIGGGTTEVSSDIGHYGIFLGMRHSIRRIYGEGGIGYISQKVNYSYDPPVSNPGVGDSVEYKMWYCGVGVKIIPHIWAGIKHYESMGVLENMNDNYGAEDVDISANSVHITILF